MFTGSNKIYLPIYLDESTELYCQQTKLFKEFKEALKEYSQYSGLMAIIEYDTQTKDAEFVWIMYDGFKQRELTLVIHERYGSYCVEYEGTNEDMYNKMLDRAMDMGDEDYNYEVTLHVSLGVRDDIISEDWRLELEQDVKDEINLNYFCRTLLRCA